MGDILPKHHRLIMVVEDNPDDVFFIKRALTKTSIKNPALFAKDGEEAMAFLTGKKMVSSIEENLLPLFILLDLKLPRVSGFEFLSWLRTQKIPLKLTPVIVLTSSTRAEDINRAFELGANSYLVKPVNFESLMRLFSILKMFWIALNEPPRYYLSFKNE